MRNIFCLFVIVLFTSNQLRAQAKNYGPVEFDAGGGYIYFNLPDKGWDGYYDLSLEFRYNATDKSSFGFEGGLIYRAAADANELGIGRAERLLLFREQYLRGDNDYRGFYGMGAGIFSFGSITAFGVSPRIGYELGPMRFVLQYNKAFKADHIEGVVLKIAVGFGGRYKSE